METKVLSFFVNFYRLFEKKQPMMGTPLLHAKRFALFTILVFVSSYCSAINYTWIKNGAPGNWGTAANWSPAGVPGINDVANFDGTGTANCTQDVPGLSIQQLNIAAAYTGTITNTINSINVSQAINQAGGTFNGGSGAITVTGSVVISGGTFISTSGILTVNAGPFTLSGSGVFDANGGTAFLIDEIACTDFQVNGNFVFFNLTYSTVPGQTPLCGFTFQTNGNITVEGCFSNAGSSRLFYNNGTVNLHGCVCIGHGGGSPNNIGSTVFNLNGTGTQVLYGWTNSSVPTCSPGTCVNDIYILTGRIPNLRIEKAPTDTVVVEGLFNITVT